MDKRLSSQVEGNFHFISSPSYLTREFLANINPVYIFFPHWSWMVPEYVWGCYESIIFHMTDLPFGRGGSPLQNLIERGLRETKISAIRCEAGLDTGPVYLKRDLSLYGGAEEIYIRASSLTEEMITEIIRTTPEPKPQATTDAEAFKRRKPADGDIANLDSLQQVFDFIRMLDAQGYPPAFLDVGNFRFEFKRAALRTGKIEADVTIRVLPQR